MSVDLFSLGAEPVDLQAVHLLWKSPWWAKALESMEEFPLSEEIFVTVVGRLYRASTHFNKRKVTMKEFADLASMARKVRWKNVNPRGFGPKHRGLMLKKLQNLRWNPAIARFEFDPDLIAKVKPPSLPKPWEELSKNQKRREASKLRKWKKEHKEERQAERLERVNRVSDMLTQSLE